MDKRRSIPPLSEGGPGRMPLGPRRRADRCARAPQKEVSDGYPEGHHREHPTTSVEGGVRDARTPASGTGRAVEHNRHCWYCCTDARYWHRRALSTTCMGYQHRRALYPPRGVDNPLTMSTTPSRCRQRAPAFAPPRFHCGRRGPRPPGCAHKDPDLRNTSRTQGRDQALVCGAVLLNSVPCVRHGLGKADACCRAGVPSGPSGGWAQRGREAALWWDQRMRGRTLFGTRSRRFAFQIIYEYLY